MKVIEDMDMVEVIFGEEIFEEEVIFEVDIIIEWIGIWKIGEHGDNPGQEKRDRDRQSWSPSSSRLGSRTSTK